MIEGILMTKAKDIVSQFIAMEDTSATEIPDSLSFFICNETNKTLCHEVARQCRLINVVISGRMQSRDKYIIIAPSWDDDYHAISLDDLVSALPVNTVSSFIAGFSGVILSSICPLMTEDNAVQMVADDIVSTTGVVVICVPHTLFLWNTPGEERHDILHSMLFLSEAIYTICDNLHHDQSGTGETLLPSNRKDFANEHGDIRGDWIATRYPVALRILFNMTFILNVAIRYSDEYNIPFNTHSIMEKIKEWIFVTFVSPVGSSGNIDDIETICNAIKNKYGADGLVTSKLLLDGFSHGMSFPHFKDKNIIMPKNHVDLVNDALGYAKVLVSAQVQDLFLQAPSPLKN